jgi:putative membrane protein
VFWRSVVWALFWAHLVAQPVYSLLPANLERAGTLFIVLTGTAFGFMHLAVSRSLRASLTMMGLCLVVAGGLEALSVATGFPYGHYVYSSLLGPGILGVPLLVPFCWQMMSHNAGVVARLIHPRGWIIVAAGALTAWDLYVDPQNVRAGYWIWERGSGPWTYAGIPLENFAGWLLTALIIYALYARLERPQPTPRVSVFELLPVLVYVWMWFGSAVVNLFWWNQPLVALVGFVGTGLFAVPALRVLVHETRAGRLRWFGSRGHA